MISTGIHPLQTVMTAQARLSGTILRTPLIRLNLIDSPAEIYLKLENLQPTGSFKVRGAGNALLSEPPSNFPDGVWTASAGNMGQALAWYARKLSICCTVVVPDDAPSVKVDAIRDLGAVILPVPFAEYQTIQTEGGRTGMKGRLIHPFADAAVMTGNGTIGLEILEDLPEVDSILVPYGGGGLSCGIAAAVRAAGSQAKVYAVELATATPLTSSLSAGRPVEVLYQPSFVSGMGAPFVFPQMWNLARNLLDGSYVVELEQAASAIRLLAERHHIIVEGAGAIALAAALSEKPTGKIVCVVSGGNLNFEYLTKILLGKLP